MADLVVDLADRRPIWAQPDWFAEELRRAAPADWRIRVMEVATEGTGDGSTRVAPQVLEAVADARVYLGYGIAEEVLEAGPELAWVHTGSAGVGSSITPTMRARRPLFTNSAGIHGPPMAEAVVGMLLHFTRGFDLAATMKRGGAWDTSAFYAADAPIVEVGDLTVGIVGWGGVGREVSRRLSGLGPRVLGLKRSPPGDAGPDATSVTAPDGTEVVWGDDGFARVLAESDVVVVTLPDTPHTRRLFDAAAFAAMKPGALFINVARGKLVVESALVAALEEGRLRGAGLDVFATEPLPGSSPLWHMENVLLTPHVSPVTPRFWRRQADLVLHNLRCFVEGRPRSAWRNLVDLEAGY
jgi:phosphoglycerate dehydrogenase-like enzyme